MTPHIEAASCGHPAPLTNEFQKCKVYFEAIRARKKIEFLNKCVFLVILT
jgi:hypothetical protein